MTMQLAPSTLASDSTWSEIIERIRNFPRWDLALIMTQLLLILAGPSYWYAKVPLNMLAVAGLILPSARRSRTYWLSIATVMFAVNYLHFYTVDNHKHLLGYWCGAVYLALLSSEPERVLAVSARWLIALAFTFALFWKLYAPEFASGGFFQFALLLDERFRNLTEVVGGLRPDLYQINRAAVASLHDQTNGALVVRLTTGPMIPGLARAMAWWTIGLEALVALAFLVPTRTRLARYRDIPLLVFVVSTYALAPVLGFGYLLIAMGLTQSPARGWSMRAMYVAAFVCMYANTTPWRLVAEFFLGDLT